MAEHAAGFVVLVGAPNSGKSTLLNRVLGQKISITSSKPQTTRNRVVGILTEPDFQAVLVDTPGIHEPRSPLHRAMVESARNAVGEVDVACWVVDLVRSVQALERGGPVIDERLELCAGLLERHAGVPLTIALNKVDIVPKPAVLSVIADLDRRFPSAEQVPLSALTGDGVDRLVGAWRGHLPEGPALFPADQLTDAPERFVVAEIVREKVFRLTEKEVPYATAVIVEDFDEENREGEDPRVRIFARILVERESQKGILIGKGGQMLKRIGTMARHDIRALLGTRVHLELYVSVDPDWSRDPQRLRDLGYEKA